MDIDGAHNMYSACATGPFHQQERLSSAGLRDDHPKFTNFSQALTSKRSESSSSQSRLGKPPHLMTVEAADLHRIENLSYYQGGGL